MKSLQSENKHWDFLLGTLSPAVTAQQVQEQTDLATLHWETLFAWADSLLIAPLLYARLQQKGMTTDCPADFIAALHAMHDANQARNRQHRAILLDALHHLNQAGIVPVLIKGAHALLGLLPDANERIISDIDILIPDGKVLEAKAALMAAGFYPQNSRHEIDDAIQHHHHISPLFHPARTGYVELHHSLYAAELYPELIPCCFQPNVLLQGKYEGATFYYQQPWQLLLYNQIHHYHAALDRLMLDVRHLVEQAALLQKVPDAQQLRDATVRVWGKHLAHADRQYRLIEELLHYPVPFPLQDTPQTQRHNRLILSCLMGNKQALQQRRILASWAMLTYLGQQICDPDWLRQRIFNWEWYRSRPALFRKYLRTGYILR